MQGLPRGRPCHEVGLSFGLEEDLYDCDVTVLARDVEGSESILLLKVHRGTSCDKNLHNLRTNK